MGLRGCELRDVRKRAERQAMSFDPEKVERLYFDERAGLVDPDPDGEYVRFSDYDQLLALYREERPARSTPPSSLRCTP